eukprot:CAMPEP_0114997678 /NCGR_PEP_ID=MMETSP0216-20121206/15043_1 /TAXON_ID=223996 /ORGANISM="Protocruzia adherens, Strain Boccale" /LENGTH=805 /DNA_ID=CAMNT_0002362107 /DNA_START=123 /DNA_END=2540 /DNA_ORIENTATION=+
MKFIKFDDQQEMQSSENQDGSNFERYWTDSLDHASSLREEVKKPDNLISVQKSEMNKAGEMRVHFSTHASRFTLSFFDSRLNAIYERYCRTYLWSSALISMAMLDGLFFAMLGECIVLGIHLDEIHLLGALMVLWSLLLPLNKTFRRYFHNIFGLNMYIIGASILREVFLMNYEENPLQLASYLLLLVVCNATALYDCCQFFLMMTWTAVMNCAIIGIIYVQTNGNVQQVSTMVFYLACAVVVQVMVLKKVYIRERTIKKLILQELTYTKRITEVDLMLHERNEKISKAVLKKSLSFHPTTNSSMSAARKGSTFKSFEDPIQLDIRTILLKIDKISIAVDAAKEVIITHELSHLLQESRKFLNDIKRRMTNSRSLFSANEKEIQEKERTTETIKFVYEGMVKVDNRSKRGGSGTPRPGLTKIMTFTKFEFEKDSDLKDLLRELGKNWNFDTWQLNSFSPGNALRMAGEFLFHDRNFNSEFQISKHKVSNFLVKLEQGYKENPYHNQVHAADVMASMYYIVNNSDKVIENMSNLDIMTMCLAALAHDVGHPARTNRFLINTKSDEALLYNDLSVLENMHCSVTFKLLSDPSCNLFENFELEAYTECRKTMIEMILSTDLSKHFDLVGRFKASCENNSLNFSDYADRLLVFQLCLKAADIGHSSKSLDLHKNWSAKVTQEFFEQGDAEKELGLPISALCDRNTTFVPESQVGFLKNLAIPLFDAVGTYLDSHSFNTYILEQLQTNLEHWESEALKKPQAMSPRDHSPRSNGTYSLQYTSDEEHAREKVAKELKEAKVEGRGQTSNQK